MIDMNHVAAAYGSGEYWEVSLVESGNPSHFLRATQSTCALFRAALDARVIADQQRNPTEALQRSWLREIGESEAALPARAQAARAR